MASSKKINLLPTTLAPSGGILKLVNLVNRLTLTIFIIFFILGSIAGGFLFISIRQENDIKAKNQTLTQNIKSQEQTEQKLFLIKDRIQKSKIIVTTPGAVDNINKLNKVLSGLPPDISLSSALVDPHQTKFSVMSKSSLSMTSFLESILGNNDYKNISLVNFSFNPTTGYEISLEVSS